MMSHETQLQYDNVILDWDGTLGKTLHVLVDGYTQTFTKKNLFTFSEEEVIASMGSFRARIQNYWKQSQDIANELVAETHQLVTPQLEQVELYPEAAMLVQALGYYGVRQAIATKSHAETVKKAARHNGIYEELGAFVGGNELCEAHQKPNRKSVDLALERLGDIGGHSRTLVVGDSLTDLLTAQNAGVHSVLFCPPQNKPFYDFDELRKGKPTYEVTNLLDIVEIVVGDRREGKEEMALH